MNKQPEPIALIDMDGTLCDYDGAMTKAMSAIAGPNDRLYWHDDAPAYMIERKRMIQSLPGFWRNLQPLLTGVSILGILQDLKFKMNVLTKGPSNRSVNAWSEKVEWCRQNLPGIPVTITEDKGLVYGKILVDDWPRYIERWLEWRPRGQVFMPAQPWNRDFSHPNVIRVGDKDLDLVRSRAIQIRETYEDSP